MRLEVPVGITAGTLRITAVSAVNWAVGADVVNACSRACTSGEGGSALRLRPCLSTGFCEAYNEHVEQRGEDVDEIARWVIAHGGLLRKLPYERHRGLGPDYGRILPGANYCVSSAAALTA